MVEETVMEFLPSVIVDDFDVRRTRVGPSEADPPLLINPDAVLPRPVASELLQMVSGRNPKVAQCIGGIKYQ
jgi:hypothetical protein